MTLTSLRFLNPTDWSVSVIHWTPGMSDQSSILLRFVTLEGSIGGGLLDASEPIAVVVTISYPSATGSDGNARE
jgi:hypothetical protein